MVLPVISTTVPSCNAVNDYHGSDRHQSPRCDVGRYLIFVPEQYVIDSPPEGNF